MLAAVLTLAVTSALPRFSWDTVPVFYHSCNFTGEFTDEAIEIMAKFPMARLSRFCLPVCRLGPLRRRAGGERRCHCRGRRNNTTAVRAVLAALHPPPPPCRGTPVLLAAFAAGDDREGAGCVGSGGWVCRG